MVGWIGFGLLIGWLGWLFLLVLVLPIRSWIVNQPGWFARQVAERRPAEMARAREKVERPGVIRESRER